MYNLIELQAFLNKGIIKVKEKETTLFDIAGFPHYENVVSNIYAYFFDPIKPHGLGTLFLDSLQELLGTNFVFNSPEIIREHSTSNGGRIDLVIQDKDQKNNKAIIIENKIYHAVFNDLEDYFKSISQSNKRGVLLTIYPTNSPHERFTNITHKTLINKIFQNIGQLILTIPEQSLFILKEFSKNLNNFTMNHEVGDYFNFYQSNIKSINAIEKLTKEIKHYMWSQIELVPQLLEDINLSIAAKNNEWFRYYRSNKTEKVFLTILPNIFNVEQPSITIIIELNYAGIERLQEVNSLDFTEDEKYYLKETTRLRKNYLHYASRQYDVTRNEFENLGKFLHDTIAFTPLKSIFTKIESHFALDN